MASNIIRSLVILSERSAIKLSRALAFSLLLLAGVAIAPGARADVSDIRVYKGELRIIFPDNQARNRLAIRYRSKTQEVRRIALDNVTLTNMATQRIITLPERSASLQNRIDRAGYWNIDIGYDGLKLGQDQYRIEGTLTLYLIGSQRTSDFSAYLQPRPMSRPEGSSIDWGLSD
jgi:hypothetical protein